MGSLLEIRQGRTPIPKFHEEHIITDQAKGLVDSVKAVLPQAGHFHCSYHRGKNIEKYCKGGKKVKSAWWYYNKLLGARRARDVEQIQMECANKVSQKALNYVNALNNHEQYPVRCGARQCGTKILKT
jgi:hypothetical protein